jgi:2-succinyl-5-enolpyruvyl-6-hydroxy-3-cyclohexene-1-carboxylate synthase
MVDADAAPFCRALAGALPEHAGRTGWAEAWLDADARARGAIRSALEETGDLFEGRLFAELAELLPDGATLVVGNSMPVRDLETFFGSTGTRVRVLGNRGANGIDGVVSTALGAAAVSEGPLVLAIGDLAFYHDMNGLLAAKLYGLDATILLINNDGGGIFSFLPQAEHPAHFEAVFGTPAGLDFRHAAALYGARHILVDTIPAFRDALAAGLGASGLTVVEARTPDRERNVRLHREVWAAVSAALRAETAVAGGGR